MVKHTQTIRWLLPTSCLSVFDHFVGLVLEVFKLLFWLIISIIHNLLCTNKTMFNLQWVIIFFSSDFYSSFIHSSTLSNIEKTTVTRANLYRQKNYIIIKKVKSLVWFFIWISILQIYVVGTRHKHLGSFHGLVFCLKFALSTKTVFKVFSINSPVTYEKIVGTKPIDSVTEWNFKREMLQKFRFWIFWFFSKSVSILERGWSWMWLRLILQKNVEHLWRHIGR